ncbi:V-type ATP synthase subunit F [Candidatus Margulisiibacteriota bacterium]
MNKIAFIGPKVLAKMMRLQGLDCFECSNEVEVVAALEKIFNQNTYSLTFITEALAMEISELDKFLTNDKINIMIIPDNRGSSGLMQDKIDRLIKNALGGEVNID